ncbi:MAG: YbhB/YbcL family Raf kinase inhibitor-like protein [Anaerolineales bacterium]
MKIKMISLVLFLLTACSLKPGNPPPTPPNPATNSTPVYDSISSNGIFMLTSSAVEEGGALPKEFTCDGASATLPLSWKDAPEGTKSFAVIMHHIPGPGDSHWYWVLYNIPAEVTSLEKNSMNVGILGNNSVNGETTYAPPCSKGPGEKVYTYTVYALSAEPQLSVSPSDVTRDVLLNAIKDITLASAALNVTYTR